MVVFSGNDFYFDEYEQGISEGFVFDGKSGYEIGYSGYSGYSGIANFDAWSKAIFSGNPTFSTALERYDSNEPITDNKRTDFIGVISLKSEAEPWLPAEDCP